MYTIYHDLFIDASKSEVFKRISEPEHLVNWWPLKCSGSPEVGAIYNFFFGPEYDWYAKVITCEENKAFHLQMTKTDPDWATTSFGFDLKTSENLIRLEFSHQGWLRQNEHFRIASFCWAMLLNGLKNYVEKGIVVPFDERN